MWPLPKTPSESQESDWSSLKKGGPLGFYLVLKALSFLSKMAWYADERLLLDELIEDVSWVLGEISKQENGGKVLGKRRTTART